jgi:hypothetical protein
VAKTADGFVQTAERLHIRLVKSDYRKTGFSKQSKAKQRVRPRSKVSKVLNFIDGSKGNSLNVRRTYAHVGFTRA